MREDRVRSPHSQAAARLVGARGPVSQGRVPIRRRARRLRLPGREVADADPAAAGCAMISKGPITATRKPAAPVLCARDARTTPAQFSASKTRTFSIAWPSAPQSEAGDFSTARREVVEHPFRQHQAVDVSGCLPDARPRQLRAEFSLTALAYNLRRALNILYVEAMTAAVAA